MKLFLITLATYSLLIPSQAQERIEIYPGFDHLRNAEPREWSHFPATAQGEKLVATFDLEQPDSFAILTLRQSDVKQTWTVILNGANLGTLSGDDNDLEHWLPIPSDTLTEIDNTLVISTSSPTPDDIHVGELSLHSRSRDELAREARISVTVKDKDTHTPLPSRLTIVDAEKGNLVLLGAKSEDHLAVRPGVIYTSDGRAEFGLNAGSYKIWAGRGFEYSLAETMVHLEKGASEVIALTIEREVDTSGLIACDPHLHTGEFAGHGDATLVERLITIAGEGIELPISTEHDQHIDYITEARRIGTDHYYTPVVGCEVTTQIGHFGAFPVHPDAPIAQHRLRPWSQIFRNIYSTPDVRVVILNHPRDIHAGFRPLDPAHFDATSGQFTDDRKLEANGLEVINSGAQQSDPMQLVHDWMALLKSGHPIAAVGSSDSHTVNFAIVGQARTYIRGDDSTPGEIDIKEAVDNFLAGHTHVSFGLLTTLQHDNGRVTAKVLGPGWTQATKLTLFADGDPVDEVMLSPEDTSRGGLKIERQWSIEELNIKDGQFLVAVAEGPGISEPWWRMMPPYQAETPEYEPYVMGISPAVWIRSDK